jgi:Transposase, Mutator family
MMPPSSMRRRPLDTWLVAAIGATVPGDARQRYTTHYAVNLMSITSKSSWPWARTLLHPIFDQHDAECVVAQYNRTDIHVLVRDRSLPHPACRLPRTGDERHARRPGRPAGRHHVRH